MKNIWMLFLGFLLFNNSLFAQPYLFEPGDEVNVFASSGLNVRHLPGAAGEVIHRLKYGDQVQVLEVTEEYEQIENRSGVWIKVQQEGMSGYIFSGFTTKLVLPDFDYIGVDCFNDDTFLRWCEEILGEEVVQEKGSTRDPGFGLDEKEVKETRWERYSDGSVLSTTYLYEGRYTFFESYRLTPNDVINFLECKIRHHAYLNCKDEKAYHHPIINFSFPRYSDCFLDTQYLDDFKAYFIAGKLIVSYDSYVH